MEFFIKNFIPVIIIVIINYCYLLSHSKIFTDSLKYTIPLLIFILYICFIFILINAGGRPGDYAGGYAPAAAAMLILPVFMILVLVLEIAVIRNLVRDLGLFFSSDGSAGRKWSLVSILAFLSVLAHAAGIIAITGMESNPDRTRTLSVNGRTISFNGRYGLKYQGDF